MKIMKGKGLMAGGVYIVFDDSEAYRWNWLFHSMLRMSVYHCNGYDNAYALWPGRAYLKCRISFRWDIFKEMCQRIKHTRIMFYRELPRIPANSNPFLHDSYHMGTDIIRGWLAMHEGFDSKEDRQPLPYVILINTRTGKRIRIALPHD